MLRNEFTVFIDRPADEVFAFVTDLPRTPEWRTSVRQADALEGRGRLGGRQSLHGRHSSSGSSLELGARGHYVGPAVAVRLRLVEGSFPMEVEHRCETHGEGCRFTMVGSANKLEGVFGRIVVPMIAWGMRRELRTISAT